MKAWDHCVEDCVIKEGNQDFLAFYTFAKDTVLTIIVPAAIIHFSRNFGQNLLSKMRLLFELRLLF